MNLKAKCLSSIGLLCLLCLMLPNTARADDFTFSFTGDLGTVTGEIFGLTNNTTGPATDVIITNFPAALESDPALVSPSTDLFASPYILFGNSFTETVGAISDWNFTAFDPATFTVFNLLSIGGEGLVVNGTPIQDVSENVVFAPVATPEPSSFSLMLIGLVALGTMAAVGTRKPLGQSQVS